MQPPPFDPSNLHAGIAAPPDCALRACRDLSGDVLVLGAAGKMGLHLCMMLKNCFGENRQSNRVIAVSRFSEAGSEQAFRTEGIDTLACDLSDPDQLAALPEVENLWFLAGVKFGTGNDPALLQKMNVEMPERVAKRFRNSRIVALSTGCVYSFVSAESGGSTETDPTASVGAYAESCRGREAAFRKQSEETGLKCVLIRLNYAVEMRYGVLVDIAQHVLRGEPVDLSMNCFNCIWQGDALGHIVAAISLTASPAAVLNVTGPEILSIRETAERFGVLFGRAPVLRGSEQPTTWLNDARKSHAFFGAPRIHPDQMISWTAAWLMQGGELLGKPTKFEDRSGVY
jgi:nucleoside-diphosphate-sugar epimerase